MKQKKIAPFDTKLEVHTTREVAERVEAFRAKNDLDGISKALRELLKIAFGVIDQSAMLHRPLQENQLTTGRTIGYTHGVDLPDTSTT